MIRGARILIVDDEPISRDVLSRMLASRGLRVDSVEDGASCLEWLESHEADLVLLDVSMPDMSGLDVLHWIRQRKETALLPVILVSALIDSEAVVAGLEAGANDYVSKPINPPTLLARIAVGLTMKRSIDRLVEAERHREVLNTLADVSERLADPVRSVAEGLERLRERSKAGEPPDAEAIEKILEQAGEAQELVARLRKVAQYRREPYTEGLASFITAALEAAIRGDDGES